MDARTSSGAPTSLRRAAPRIAIAALIAATQAVRDQWADAALFLIVAVALSVDALRASPPFVVPRRPGRVATAIVVLAAGIVLSFAPRYSMLMGIGLAAVGLLAVPFAWAGRCVGPTARSERATGRATLAWALTVVVACACELAAFIFGRIVPDRSGKFPSISMVVDPLLHQPWPRALFILG